MAKKAKAKKKPVAARKTVKAKKSVKKIVMKAASSKKSKRKNKVQAIPKGYTALSAYLIVDDAAAAIDFYKSVFNAKEILRYEHGGKVSHSELKFGDSLIMVADEHPEMDCRSPKKFGGSPVSIHLYVKNVDVIVEDAVASGATLVRPVANMFYGDRSGTLTDPYGHKWHVSTHVEDVSPKETKKRAEAFYSQQKNA